MTAQPCPICNTSGITEESTRSDSVAVHCPMCAHYVITASALASMGRFELRDRRRLAGRIRRRWMETRQPMRVSTDTLDDPNGLAGDAPIGVLAKVEALLFDMAARSQFPGQTVDAGPNEWVVVDAQSSDEFAFYLDSLYDRGLIVRHKQHGFPVITPEGWQLLEARRNPTTGNRSDFFVAMEFSDELRPAWELGIRPAAQAAGYVAKRVDSDAHNDKIDDRIIAGIRAAFGPIVDVTNRNPGAYFEAGFALGLGRPVVWTVREDHIGKLHFDTRQFLHIVWKDPADLAAKLETHLLAVFGKGPAV